MAFLSLLRQSDDILHVINKNNYLLKNQRRKGRAVSPFRFATVTGTEMLKIVNKFKFHLEVYCLFIFCFVKDLIDHGTKSSSWIIINKQVSKRRDFKIIFTGSEKIFQVFEIMLSVLPILPSSMYSFNKVAA